MTFTKEQLIAAAHGRIDFANMMLFDNPEPLQERTWSIELELARIALSALRERAEPVGYRKLFTCSSCGAEGLDEPLESRCHCNGDGARWIEGRLYTAPYLAAPPAPVVADDAQPERGFRYNKDEPYGLQGSSAAPVVPAEKWVNPDIHYEDENQFAKGWNDCRQYAIGHSAIPPIVKCIDTRAQGWNACRAAMLQPVSQPYKLPEREG